MKCKYCGEIRETEFYSSNKITCKACIIKRSNLWAKKHPGKVKQKEKRRREKHKEKIAKYYREWYAKGGRNRAKNYAQVIMVWQKNHPVERKVRHIVERAIQKGELTRPLYCALCGRESRIQAHHEDYSKAFDILWVCASCHKKIHLGA